MKCGNVSLLRGVGPSVVTTSLRVRFALGVACLGLFGASASAQDTYLGLYLQGTKIGYSSYSESLETVRGKAVARSDSKTVMNTEMLGAAMGIVIDTVTWSRPNGAPSRILYTQSSGGRTQVVDARFEGRKIFCSVNNAGQKSTRTLTVPVGASVTDDPLKLMMGANAGAVRRVYVLDPTTVSLVVNEVVSKGKSSTMIKGIETSASLVEIRDPRATMKVFLSSKGDLLKVDGPMGIEMIPEAKEIALAKPDAYKPTPDLAFATSLKTDKPISNPGSASYLDLRISGPDLSRVKSDDHQSVAAEGTAWRIKVHPPVRASTRGASIAEAGRQQARWVKPSLNIPSDARSFRDLARKVIGTRKRVMEAATAVQDYVYGLMRPNAGIGVLRDATDVLKTKEGVCRDYAILTAAILRAGGVPTRLCSGLVNWDGDFFYHAWVEVWSGKQWIGVDSTTSSPQLSATHVKLASGNVEDAFTFQFLEKAKIEVLEAR